MKRYVLTIFSLLLSLGLSAQTSRTCRYWFDGNFGQSATQTVNGNICDVQIDVSQLSCGTHTLHYYLIDESSTPVRSSLFIKIEPLGDLAYHCWFDNDENTEQTGAVGNGNILLDVTSLENGDHTVSMYLKGSTISAPQTYVFLNNLAVDENESGSLVVYPNPAKDRLTIESEEIIRHCEIYDLTGQLVKTLENDSERMEISIEALPAGTYLVKLVTDSFAQTRRLIKK